MHARIAVVALVALSLCGCVAVPPPGPTDADIADFNQTLLDRTWARTGLDGIADRPEASAGKPLDEDSWSRAMGECMSDKGITSFGTSYSAEAGFEFVQVSGAEAPTIADQFIFYSCVAAHPLVPSRMFEALSDEQLDYIYDYYQSWLIPCAVMQGYSFSDVPTRTEFKALAGQWSPYYSVDIAISGADYEELERVCGAERPSLY